MLESACLRWGLKLVDVVPRHGYLSLVWQVRRGAELYALKLAVPSKAFEVETDALVVWDGRAMVRLVERDVERGAAILQWLDASVSLADVPLDQAVEVAGELLTVVPEVDRRTAERFSAVRVEPTWWRRYAGPEDSIERTKRLCDLAGLDEELCLDWLLVRTVDYALWAFEAG